MSRPMLQHCVNGCCFFIDGKLVTQPEYESALQQHKAFETISMCYHAKPRCQDVQGIDAHIGSPRRREHA
jgi:hypothetical protein